jgi:hypothetical protein
VEGKERLLVPEENSSSRIYIVTSTLEMNPDSRSTIHKIPRLLWDLNRNSSMDPILMQMNPVHIIIPYLFMIHFNIILESTPRSPMILLREEANHSALHLKFTCAQCTDRALESLLKSIMNMNLVFSPG